MEISYILYIPINNIRTTCIPGNVRLDRYQMDRRRLEEAHFQFAILHMASWYPQHMDIDKLALHGSTKSTLLDVVSIYHGVFMDQYASVYPLKY